MNISNQAIQPEDETKLLRRYFSKTFRGGNNMIKCSLYDFSFNELYTRVRTHLKLRNNKLELFQKRKKKCRSTTCI